MIKLNCIESIRLGLYTNLKYQIQNIKMKKIPLTILFSFFAAFSFSQSAFDDVVYLKNGGIIRGLIIEQIPNKSIKIQTADKNVFVYQLDEVEKITKDLTSVSRSSSNVDKTSESVYKGTLEFGYQSKVGEFGMNRIKFNIINGFQINPYISVGFGTGARYYFDSEAMLVPLFFDFRTNFINKRISPYFSVGTGYSFDASNKFEDVGLILNPNLGVEIKISDGSSFNFGIGYEMQKMKFILYDYYYYYYQEFIENSGTISINIGVSF